MSLIAVTVFISYFVLYTVRGSLVEIRPPAFPRDFAIYQCTINHGFLVWNWTTLSGTVRVVQLEYPTHPQGYIQEQSLEEAIVVYNVTDSSASLFTVVATVQNSGNLNGTMITCGGQSVTIKVSMRSPPVQITLQSSGGLYYDPSRSAYVIVEGSSLVLNCSFQASPKASVIWKHNGTKILSSIRYATTCNGNNTHSEHTLMVQGVVEKDSGDYSCNATNLYGTGEVTESVKVIIPPTVTAITEEVIGVETRDNSSSAVALGFTITRADPEVSSAERVWTYMAKNNNNQWTALLSRLNVTNDNLILTLTNPSLSDTGTFTLTATNEAGSHNASVQLIVHVEPEIIDMNSINNVAQEKSEMSFWCFADGVPEPSIVWLHNESLILVDTSPRHHVMTERIQFNNRPNIPAGINSTLTITNVHLRDSGEYLCRIDPDNIDNGRQHVPEPFVLVVFPEANDYCKSKPCQNGGVCSNVTNGYLCICDPFKWKGVNCTIEILEFNSPSIEINPVFEDFPALFTTTQVMCQVSGSPQPNITWYKDGVLLPGQRNQNLILEEVSLKDRGRYHCVAQNYDPSISRFQLLTDVSVDILLNIRGIVQYKAELNIVIMNGRRRRQTSSRERIIVKISARLSGVRVPQYNATVYSVTEDAQSKARPDHTNVIITLLAPEGNAGLRDTVFHRLQQIAPEFSREANQDAQEITPISISRFDGCEAEDTILKPLEPGGLNITLKWPESNLGEKQVLQCPCGNLFAISGQDISNAKASRVCGGNFSHGGEWETPFVSPCNFSTTTRRLCLVANIINEPDEAISALNDITSNEENIGSTEIGVTTILLETLQSIVMTSGKRKNLTKGLLTIVDNLLDAAPEKIQDSQEASNSSARILNVVETLSEQITFSNNETQAIIPLTSFAVAVQEVNIENFYGQVFSANLRDFNFTGDEPIDVMTLTIDQSRAPAVPETSSLSIPQNIFNNDTLRNNMTNRTRITNFVFFNDVLFSRRNSSASAGSKVGSIIMAASLSNDRTIENLSPPVLITFLKKLSQENETTATCQFWDFSGDDGFGDWSTRGCTVANETDTMVTCECNHLTNFAILLDSAPVRMAAASQVFVTTLSALSYIGALVSIFCLIITIITHILSRKLRHSQASQLLINLSVAMVGLYTMYIISLHAAKNQYACAFAGGLLHYFMLASFFSMAAEAVNLYTKLVLVIGVPLVIKNKYVLKACLIVWIVPVIIVILSEAPNWSNYVSDYFCRPFYGAFYGGLLFPFITIYIFNWVIFTAIFWSLLRKKVSKVGNKSKLKLRHNVIIAVTLSLLFGLGWGVGLVATSRISVASASYTLQTFFVLLTSFQGLWIFVMTCVRSEEARNQWKLWVRFITCRKINLEKRDSITGQISGSNLKAAHIKSELPTSKVLSAQSLQCILRNDTNSSIVGSNIIETEQNIFTPTLGPTGENMKIDFCPEEFAKLTSNISASNPSFHVMDNNDNTEAHQSAVNINNDKIEITQTKLDSLSITSGHKSAASEAISLHSIKTIVNDTTLSNQCASSESENIEFDILWVKNEHKCSSCLSLKSLNSNQGVSDHLDPLPSDFETKASTTSPFVTLTASHMDLPAASHMDLPAASHMDLPAASHMDLPAASHMDLPAASHLDLPAASHIDLPAVSHTDPPAATHMDLPAASDMDVPIVSHEDLPAASHMDQPIGSQTELFQICKTDLLVTSQSSTSIDTSIQEVVNNSDNIHCTN